MSTILALDTSAEACSVALLADNTVEELFELAPRDHTRLILPMVDRLLAQCGVSLGQLDAIAFGAGPGAFTGLRISAGVVQGLAFGAQLPVIPVSSLAAVAQGFFAVSPPPSPAQALVCMDARMGELYFGAYAWRDGEAVLEGRERLLAPTDLLLDTTDAGVYHALGSGWRYLDQMPALDAAGFASVDTGVLPRAKAIAQLGSFRLVRGETISAGEVEPVYLREQVAWKKVGQT